MKYLKRFNESNITDNKSIDWDFISDVKELALEYIDEGWTLSWGVECKTSLVRPKEYRTLTVVSGLYNHNENTTDWGYDYDKDEDFSDDELSYQFYFSRTEGLDMSTIRGILNKEFRNKLREMFPDKPFEI
jgi:hypothetical protein